MVTHSSATALAATPHATDNEHKPSKDNSSADNASEDNANQEKIAALAEKICAAGEEAAASLFVLMGTLQYSTDPAADANAVKHLAFTRCGELNVLGMVDAYLAMLERNCWRIVRISETTLKIRHPITIWRGVIIIPREAIYRFSQIATVTPRLLH